MLTEAQNFAVVQTELDDVFYQKFDYDATTPGIATARTAELFKPIDTTHASYIQEVFKGWAFSRKLGKPKLFLLQLLTLLTSRLCLFPTLHQVLNCLKTFLTTICTVFGRKVLKISPWLPG